MKTFSELLEDLENLRGIQLNSISGQSVPFTIQEIDRVKGCLRLDVKGENKSRPLEELRRIWEEMCAKPAVHVDSVLGGSGSRRSQPETILANLPYVEWLNIQGKKNIAYIGEDTHQYGQLKKMADVQAEEYKQMMRAVHPRNPLLPPLDEEATELTREDLMAMENKDFIFSVLQIMSRHHLFNGFTLPILESREQCTLLFKHNNIHGILYKRLSGMSEAEFKNSVQDDTGHTRYYAEKYSIAEDEYYVSSQWRPDREDARGAFLDWLFELLLTIKFETGIYRPFERNRIVFGAPGTGKSHSLKNDCNSLLDGTAGTFERVTFHPDYTYSQFVGCYKPITNAAGEIRYDFVPGPFMRILVAALKSGRTENPQPHLLLIEEINRAKVAAVFGDVFQLLDRADNEVSEYEIHTTEDIKKYLISELGKAPESIKIPDNMFIWATMNSADQGVFPMDTAFRRRWNFEYIGIDKNENEIAEIGKIRLAGSDEVIEWNILRKAINAKMSSEQFRINEDKLMGPFFLSMKVIASDDNGVIIDTKKFRDAFKSKVIMYLYEDAVRQGKHKFFDGCDSSRYSSVCDAFDEIGMGIFGPNFKENFYDKQRDEA